MSAPQAGPYGGPPDELPAGRVDALARSLGTTLKALSAALLATYFVLVLLQVFFRYVLNESLFWAEELVRGLMVWGVMISSALVAGSRGHIRVEVLELILPPSGRKVVMWIADALTIAFSVLLLCAAIELMSRSWMQQSPLLGIPKWTVYMALAVGAGIESLLTLLTWKRRLPVDLTVDPTL